MEFQDVVRRRRMVRQSTASPVETRVRDLLLANATRAPSAGFSQGWRFLVLEADVDRATFWSVLRVDMPVDESVTEAPLVIVPMGSKDEYLSRYAEPDKGWEDRDEARWPVPFWLTDTAMAALLILQTAVDNRLGALFLGIPPAVASAFIDAFNIPGDFHPAGGIAIGHRANDPPFVAGAERKLAEVVQHGPWPVPERPAVPIPDERRNRRVSDTAGCRAGGCGSEQDRSEF